MEEIQQIECDLQADNDVQLEQLPTQNQLLHIKIQSLEDQQIGQLLAKLKGHEDKSKLRISFQKSKIEIIESQIDLLIEIIQSNLKISNIHIKNRYSNGNQTNLIKLLEYFKDRQPILILNLDFKNNNLDRAQSDLLGQIIPQITKLSELTLNFSNHSISSQYLDTLTHLDKCSNIEKLCILMENVVLNNEQSERIIETITKIQTLKHLELNLIVLDLSSFQKVFSLIPFKLNRLKSLNLQLQYEQNEVKQVSNPDNLVTGTIESLEELNLQIKNKFGSHQLPNLHSMYHILLQTYQNISTLALNIQNIDKSELLISGQQLSKLTHLKKLSFKLFNDDINEQIATLFGEALSNLPNLQELFIHSQEFISENTCLPLLISNSSQISKLDIYFEKSSLNETVQTKIYSSFSNLRSMKLLHIKFDKLTYGEFSVNSFGTNIKKCKNLCHIYLNFQTKISTKKQPKSNIKLIQSYQESKVTEVVKNPSQTLHNKVTLIASVFRAKNAAVSVMRYKRFLVQLKTINYIKKLPKLVALQIN